MAKKRRLSWAVMLDGRAIWTLNAVPKYSQYGESLRKFRGEEHRDGIQLAPNWELLFPEQGILSTNCYHKKATRAFILVRDTELQSLIYTTKSVEQITRRVE